MLATEVLDALNLALRCGVVAVLLLVACVLARDGLRWLSACLGAALAVGLAAYVLMAVPGFPAAPFAVRLTASALSTANAVVFWVFARALFDEAFRLRGWHVAAWCALAVAGPVNCFGAVGPAQPNVLGIAITLATLGFALLAMGQTLVSWRADLVEPRRRLRVHIVGAGAAYTLVSAFGRLAAPGSLSATAATLDAAALAVIVFAIVLQMVRIATPIFVADAAQSEVPVAVPEPASQACEASADVAAGGDRPGVVALSAGDAAALAELGRLMSEAKIYRQENLSIGSLADAMCLPEYRLRRLINQGLGYRNFSAFLNHYRIHDAKRALRDPAYGATPVLSIALEVGFQSIGPFNRAFKASTGLTPSEYRRDPRDGAAASVPFALADSEIG